MSFVGIVGLKCTGKTTLLSYEANRYPDRSIYISIDPNKHAYTSLTELLYDRMYEAIYRLPWPLNCLRLDGDLNKTKAVQTLFHHLVNDKTDQRRVKIFIDFSDSHLTTSQYSSTSISATAVTSSIPYQPCMSFMQLLS